MSTKYYVLFQLLKGAGKKGATVAECAKALSFAEGSVSPYMWSLRKKFGAEIEVLKDGRKVSGYRLLNAEAVDGVITPKRRGAATKTAKVVKTKPVKVQKVAKTAKVTKSKNAPVEVEDMEIEEITDGDLADIKTQLGLA